MIRLAQTSLYSAQMGLSMLASTLLIQSKEDKNKKNRKKTANAMSDYIAVYIATYLMDATQIRSKKKQTSSHT